MADGATTWRQARRLLAAVDPLPPISVPLAAAVGSVLVAPITAATDIPVGDAADDHGWAVAGQGPWTLITEVPAHELAHLPDACAVAVAIGDQLPPGTTAVMPRRLGYLDSAPQRQRLQLADASGQPAAQPGLIGFGRGIRPQGRDAQAGQRLLASGPVVTPATVALAAAAGRDDLTVIPPASVAVILPKFGLSRSGAQRPGRQRDVAAQLLPSWIEAGPARLLPAQTVQADARAIAQAIDDLTADVIVIAGGIDPDVPAEVVRAVQLTGAAPYLAGLAVAPGGATAVHILDERMLITLPGRPDAAAAGLAIVMDPLLDALSGRPAAPEGMEALLVGSPPPTEGTILIPGILERTELVLQVHPQRWTGPAGMGGLAAADGLIVIEPRLHGEGLVPLLPLPGVLVG